MFGSSTSRALPVFERIKRLRVAKATLYEWKNEFPEAWNLNRPALAGSELEKQLQMIRGRSDDGNIAYFLTPNDHVPGTFTASSGGTTGSAGGSTFTRPDGLGPQAEPSSTFGPPGPGTLPPELVEILRRVEGQNDVTEFEQDQVLSMRIDEDAGEGGARFVAATMNHAAILQRGGLKASTNKLWDRPRRNFTTFWRALSKLRLISSTSTVLSSAVDFASVPSSTSRASDPSSFASAASASDASPASASSDAGAAIIVTEQKLVTYLKSAETEVKGISNLWETEQLLGINRHPSPRKGRLLKAYMKAVKKSRTALSSAVQEDWWKHSLRDGYDAREYDAVSRLFLIQASLDRSSIILSDSSSASINPPSISNTRTLPLLTSASSGKPITHRSASGGKLSTRRTRFSGNDESDSDWDSSGSDSENDSEKMDDSSPISESSTNARSPLPGSTTTITATSSASSFALPALPTSIRNATQRSRWARIALRSRLEFLMQHALMGRSEDLRSAILAQTYSIMLPQSRLQSCQAFVVTLRSGKANTEGRNEWGVAARHRDVETCPVGALALYLFERWHLHQLPTPNFDSRASWYNEKLLVNEGNEGVEWSDQAYLLRYAFEEAGVASSKLTHAMRSGGARFAHEAGCTEDSLRIHGRWCGDRLIERYLGGVSVQPIRALADLDIKGGDYWLPRALLTTDLAMQQEIFPFVEAEEAKVQQRHKSGGQTDHAALNFSSLLKWLRVVLLQDAVLLRRSFPHLPIWTRAPFTSAAFQDFADKLISAIEVTPTPFDVTVATLVPELGRSLGGLQSMLSDIALSSTATTAIVELHGSLLRTAVTEAVGEIRAFILELFQVGTMRNTAQQALADSMQQLAAASAKLCASPSPPTTTTASTFDLGTSSIPSAGALLPPSLPSLPVSTGSLSLAVAQSPAGVHHALSSSTSARDSASASAGLSARALSVSAMASHMSTVRELMHEWKEGGLGRRPLKLRLEETDSTLETGSAGAKKQLSRWRLVVALVEMLSVGGDKDENAVVVALDSKLRKDKVGLRSLAVGGATWGEKRCLDCSAGLRS
ncbi:hypothetical protein CF319_g8198 [Tilletia indica]|nr:hypothetical protein CF319_g8198 [Tilletia indica]